MRAETALGLGSTKKTEIKIQMHSIASGWGEEDIGGISCQ